MNSNARKNVDVGSFLKSQFCLWIIAIIEYPNIAFIHTGTFDSTQAK